MLSRPCATGSLPPTVRAAKAWHTHHHVPSGGQGFRTDGTLGERVLVSGAFSRHTGKTLTTSSGTSESPQRSASMWKRFAIALALVLLPSLARAEELKNPSPEQLLSANTQVYLRWDGLTSHRAAYDKTALGKMMQGDTGKFFAGAFTLV